MLVFPDGGQLGTLGGGCVEAEVKQRALRVLANNQTRPEVLTFQLDADYGWDDGLICGGRMTVLADPCRQSQSYYRRFKELVELGRGCTEAVSLTSAGGFAGARFLFDGEGQPVAHVPEGADSAEVLPNLVSIHKRPRPYIQKGVSYLPILPRITLLIVGAGHVGQAVAKLAAEVDFIVWVLDDRSHYASRERFPTAERLIVGDIGVSLQELARKEIHPACYAIIVTRGHNHDEEALYHLATTSASYIGMIGSKRKIKLIFDDLRSRGIPENILQKVRAPIGFEIGSQTVPEIAVSIVAELIARRNLSEA